ncbi:MAG: DUF2155 domain-containing protein [Hyphomonadaceae bacterium]|nr:DUF2155 domain-containing protein [Hyphomonadaceae bacterium]
MKVRIAAALIAAIALATPAHAAPGAILRGLDKVTGQARDFTAPVGRAVKFGTLEITVRACQKAAPEETPEVAVYLEVVDRPIPRTPDDPVTEKPLMAGWIFASNPARNALEHATYDVWAIDCRS